MTVAGLIIALVFLALCVMLYVALTRRSASADGSGAGRCSRGRPYRSQEGNDDQYIEYSFLADDISRGNIASWSGRPNAAGRYDRSLLDRAAATGTSVFAAPPAPGSPLADAPVVLQGHSLPLLYETEASKVETPLIFPQLNDHCNPGCCPSTYTCDSGCVCAQ